MKEPTTTEDYLADLKKWGCVFSGEEGNWTVRSTEGGTTSLEAEDEANAAFEAWHLMKP